MRYRFRLRRRTASEWATANEVLLRGEPGIEETAGLDPDRFKFGDGVTAWNDLPYVGESGPGGGGGAVDSVNGRTGAVVGLAEQSALTAEAASRAAADAAMDSRLDTIEDLGPLATAAGLAAESTARSGADTNEASTRAAADAALGTRLDALEALDDFIVVTDAPTVTFDLSAGPRQRVLLGGSRTLALSNDSAVKIFTLLVNTDASGGVAAWWTGITWATADGLPPTIDPNRRTALTFVRYGVNDWVGSVAWQVDRPTLPTAPTGLSATAMSATRIDLSWSALAGAASYSVERATSSGGSFSQIASGLTSPAYSDTSLSTGQQRWYRVKATNVIGTGPASSEANATTWAVPAAPTIGTATAGNASATVAWTPGSNGGTAVTASVITPYIAGVAQAPQTLGASSPQVVTGLTNGTAYTFKVALTNAVGTGAQSSASNSVTPAATTVPGAPTIGTATAGDTTAVANWTAPGSNGGSAITGYEVKTYRASDNTLLDTDTTGVVLTFNQTGLTNGVGIYFKVAAINAIGTGAQSAASNTVTPTAAGGFADNFNRADGALGTSSSGHAWSSSGMAIASNAAKRTSGTGGAFIDSLLPDFVLEATITNGNPALAEVAFQCRRTGPNDFIYAVANGDSIYLIKIEGGGITTLGTTIVFGVNTGTHTLKVTGVADVLKFFVDGVEKLSRTSNFNQTATNHGMGGFAVFSTDTTSTYDNITCTAP